MCSKKNKSSNECMENKSNVNTASCNSMNNSENVPLTSDMYDQLVKLLNTQQHEENVNANMEGVFVNPLL